MRICKACGRRGHVSATCPKEDRAPVIVPFTVEELAFFQVPREWKDIQGRFGKSERGGRSLDAVLDADCDGGRGLLWWCRATSTWRLTEEGREHTRNVAAA